MKRVLMMLMAFCLLTGAALADAGDGWAYPTDVDLTGIPPAGWSTQLEGERVDRMLDANRFTVYEHVCWESKTLDDIPDIGPNRRKTLMRQYRDIEALRAADLEELKALPGMNARAAESVVRFFHEEEKKDE